MQKLTNTIVVMGFSAEALEILAKNFNALLGRNHIVIVSRMGKEQRKEGKAGINDRAVPILSDIRVFTGRFSSKQGWRVKDHNSVNCVEAVCDHAYGLHAIIYRDALEEIAYHFNAKAKMYGLKARLNVKQKK